MAPSTGGRRPATKCQGIAPMAGSRRADASPSARWPTDAGVSVAAVSKVLRDAYGVSEALRTKVQASMQSSATGRTLRRAACGGRPIRWACCSPTCATRSSPTSWPGSTRRWSARSTSRCSASASRAATTEHALIDAMVDRQIDGVILIAPRMPTDELKTDRRPHPDRDHRASPAGRAGFRHRQQRRRARRQPGGPPPARGGPPQHRVSVAGFSAALPNAKPLPSGKRAIAGR